MFTVKADNGKFVQMHPFYKNIVLGSKPKMYAHRDDAKIQMDSIQKVAKERVKHHKAMIVVDESGLRDLESQVRKFTVMRENLQDRPYREVCDRIEKIDSTLSRKIEDVRNRKDSLKTHKADLKRFEMISNLKLTIVTL